MKWLLIIFLFSSILDAQVSQSSSPRQTKKTIVPSVRLDKRNFKALTVFHKIEQGIRTCAVDEFENELAAMVAIAIGSSERGYFSTNQAVSVLTGYFSGLRSVSFDFSSIHEEGSAPYATGRLVYVQRGIQESAQVYVSLIRQESRWVVNQFNIY
jgi:hypothetical protein